MEPFDDLLRLNFHHLRYFWMVAQEGHLTRTARRLRVSQSALSHQIRLLEQDLGEPLFLRTGRHLELTEAGRIALAYADDVFGAGNRLVATFRDGRRPGDVLRVGAMSTLSRNFQDSFLQPLFDLPDARMRLLSGSLADLLDRLGAHDLDLVLSNRAAPASGERPFQSVLLARQPVSLVGHPGGPPLRFPEGLADMPMLVPTVDSAIRTAFDALCSDLGVQPNIVGEVDDMALLRLLARDQRVVALVPAVVVRDELETGVLEELMVVQDVVESFFAVTVARHFQHPLLDALVLREPNAILRSPTARAVET